MNQVKYDTKQWEKFWGEWDLKLKKFPAVKREALEKSARAVEAILHKEIDARFPNYTDKRGRRFSPSRGVKSWQEVRIGSKNGYAAISPKSMVVRTNKRSAGEHTAATISAALERGHHVRSPSGRSKRYVPRFDEDRATNYITGINIVHGRMFYSWTKMSSGKAALDTAKKVVFKWAEELAEGEE